MTIMKYKSYVIKDLVVHYKTKQGLGGLRVEVYNKDSHTKDDYFGGDHSDSSCICLAGNCWLY